MTGLVTPSTGNVVTLGRSAAVDLQLLYLYFAGMDSPLTHHQHVWPCPEEGCAVQIPILDGFGEAILRYHRQEHVVRRLAAALEAEQAETTRLRAVLAALNVEPGNAAPKPQSLPPTGIEVQ